MTETFLSKYGFPPIEECLETCKDMALVENDIKRQYYSAILNATDHIPLKIFEDYIVFMVDNNVNVGNMKKFFADVKEEYGEILEARKFAREEINKIESATN